MKNSMIKQWNLIGCLVALAVLATACGSDSGSDSGGAEGNGAATAVAGEATTGSIDFSALPNDPIPAGMLAEAEDNLTGVPVLESVIDECSVIDTAAFTAIVESFDEIGRDYDFSAERTDRASCRFVDQTHTIDVFVQPASVLDQAFMESLTMFDPIIAEPAANGAELYFDEGLGIKTLFAGRAEREGWAVVVANSGGTGVLAFESEEDGWAELALAALDGAVATGPAPAPPASAEEVEAVVGEPCGVYEPADFAAVFGGSFTETEINPRECFWENDESTVSVSITIAPASADASWFGHDIDLGNGRSTNEFGEVQSFQGPGTHFSVGARVTSDAYGLPLVDESNPFDREIDGILTALIDNIESRLS